MPRARVSGMDGDVGVEEEDERCRRELGAEVAGRGRAERPVVTGHDGPHRPGELAGAVGRAVVDHDQLVVGPGRVTKPTEAALEVGAPVTNGDHNGKRRPPRLRARRTGGDIVHD